MMKISYNGYRFPTEIIQHAICLYIRFTLSFRDVRRWVKLSNVSTHETDWAG